MSQTPTVIRYHTTEHRSQMHGDEFIVVVDSLGRRWNPLLHPRDQNGRFIRTFSFVTFDLPGGGTASGRVSGIDRDGNLLVKVQGTTPGADPRIVENGYVKVPHDKVSVRTVKAQLTGPGTHVGVLQKQQNDSVSTSIKNLRSLGMDDEATKLEEAQRLAMAPPNPRDPKSRSDKERAIELFREVGEAAGAERGKGFSEGDDLNEVKANLSSSELARLNTLDQVTKNTYTARHSLGDNTIDVENDEGPIKGNMPEVRIEAAENELAKDYAEDAPVWDITSGSITEGQMEAPTKATVRDTVAEPQGTEALPEFWRSAYQKLRTGKNRLAGYKQAMQVAPGDRHHVDKNGDVIRVGHIVHTDATKSRAEFTGMVTRIYTDTAGKKHVYVRDFDPSGEKGYSKNYKDHSVQGKSVEIASDDQQSTLFQKLALEGQDEASKSLVKSFTEEYMATMQRRYATPDAKKISSTAGFFDVTPIHLRVKTDANGETLRIGDAVQGPNGEDGFVSYMEPNENTTKVYWHNGKSSRLTSNKLKRMHGATSDVYPDDSAPGTNNYVPTREEAAAIADEKGATSVAEVIRGGGDANAIQAAMVTDVQFQDKLGDIDALYNKRDQTRSAGQDLSDEDRAELDKWDRMFMASAGQFREPDAPLPSPPEAPAADESDELPQNPDNPTEKITEGGVTVREEDGTVIVNDDIEDPIPADDEEAIVQRVQEAEGQEPEAPAEEAPTPSLASKLVGDMGRLVDEAKQAPNTDPNQRRQLDQMMSRLQEAVDAEDGDAVVRSLQGLTGVVNRQVNANLRRTRLAAVLNGRATDGVPMADFVQQKLDAGENIFGAPEPVSRPDRPVGQPDETPEGVDPAVDAGDTAMSEALLLDDGSTLVMDGDEELTEGYYVMDPATITVVDGELTEEAISAFLTETEGSNYDAFSVWFNEADGQFRMARVGVFDSDQEASAAAANTDTNQYVNIADGLVYNVALGGDPNMPTESIEDPRAEERHVRTPGAGRASASTTAKQKSLLDHVAGSGGDEEIARISAAVKNGEEITGADASRLADFIDGLGADQFDKPSDKGLASQLAHKLARATGEEGARGYSSEATALSRGSSVGISLTAQSQSDEIRSLVDRAKEDVKNGDMGEAAKKFRDAADAFDALSAGGEQAPAERAREHAARLDAMGGTTGPAPAQAPEAETPEAPAAPAAEQEQPGTAREALDAAGMPEVEPLTQSQFSNPDTPRTRQVTPQEYSALALRGRDRLTGMLDDSAAPEALQGQTWDEVKRQAWDSVQEEWGGITVDAHSGQAVTGDDDAYALTFRPPGTETVSVPIGSSQEEFDAAMEQALTQFGGEQDSPLWAQQAHLGVFRNDDTGNYEIDPVLVLDNLDDVEAIGAYSGSEGGAYNFKDGLGYWPPYVAEEEAGGGAEEGVPGARRLESPSPEGGEAEPGVPPEEQAGQEGAGPEALEVGGTPTEVLENLFDRIGQPADYGTEHQGRMLGEARSLAGEGLTDEAADRLETAAAAAPEGSDEKRLMLEAATALRGGEAPAGGGPGTPDVTEVESVLSLVEDAIDSEQQAEGEDGPQGMTAELEDASVMLGLIQGRVTSEGPYTELSKDLRELSDWIKDHWRLTDPGPLLDELRSIADGLEGKGVTNAGAPVPAASAS